MNPMAGLWLDRAIDWAGQRHIYVILDLHGAPGGQSKAGPLWTAGVNRFFQDPADVAQCCEIWRRVAARYANRPKCWATTH